jgi:tRNA dimethylallyltransferase
MGEHEGKTLVIVAGPTAVGKTAVAISLAQHFHTEIVSADSRQLFRELTIGTAKPSPAEQALVPHHFVDSHSIAEKYDAAQFGIDAGNRIETLFKTYDKVVMCGGSGLYIRAVVEGFDDIPQIAPEIRQDLIRQYHQHGLNWLQEQMQTNDPEHFATIDQQNPHRLIRALEVKAGTGNSISYFQQKRKKVHPFNIIRIGLDLPREILYERINTRMDQMIAQGLFAEAEGLFSYREHQALKTVGYQEIFDYIEGKYDYEEAVRLLKQNSRRYAKRQLTWFRRDTEMKWFHPGQLHEMIAFIEQSKVES